MANNLIQIKRTSVSGRAANSSTLTNPGELALNMPDGIMYSTNGSVVFEIGANNTNARVTGNLTVNSIVANGSLGTSGQYLTSNGSISYWSTPSTPSITVRSTNGIGGAVNTSVSGVTAINFDQSTGFNVTDQGSGNVFVSLGSGFKYITVSGQTTITALGEDTLNLANSAGILLTTTNTAPKTLTITYDQNSSFTWTNTVSFTNTVTINSSIIANGSSGTSGQVLKSNGSSIYWGTDGADVGAAGQVLYRNSSNVLTTSSGLQYDGTSIKVNGNLESLYSNGDEGGEIFLAKPVTNTSISGTGVTIDIYQNKLRIFENGGTNRGAYIDITAASGGVGSNLLTGGGGGLGTVTSVGSANGISGGPITGSGTLYAVAGNNTIFVNASGIHVNTSALPSLVNVDAQYIWTNTHTFQANIAYTGNNISVVSNTGSLLFAGAADNNWKIGRNTGATTKQYYTNNTLDIIAADSNLEGVVIGKPGGNTYLETGYAGTFTKNPIYIGNSTVNVSINSTSFTGTSNNSTYAFGKSEADLNVNNALTSNSTSFVGSVSAANVVSNSQLSSNLANYQTTAGLSANVATLTSNNSTYAYGKSEIDLNVNSALTSNSTSYVGSISAANVVSNSQLSGNLANYQTTAGLSANVATLTSNNSTYAFGKSEVDLNVNSALTSNSTSYVGSISAANVVSNSQLSSNLANYQTTAGLAANVATLTSNNSTYAFGKNEVNLNVNSALTSNNSTYAFGKSEVNLNVNSALFANSSSYLNGNSALDLRTYTDDKAANAYSNAVAYSSNATNLSSGTVNEARLPYRMDQDVRTTDSVSFNGLTVTGNLTVNGSYVVVSGNSTTFTDNMLYLNQGVSANITNITSNGTHVVFFTSNNNYQAGWDVSVTGVTPSSYNGTYLNITSSNSSSFTVANTNTDSYVSGGTARGKSEANPDLGFAAGYNDGTYHHTGFFRDATDGVWKLFDNYDPEPDTSIYIDTSNSSFHLANFQANLIYVGNTTVYSTINTTSFSGTSNSTLYVGSVSAANVVSNSQLSSNLANYQTTAGLSANVATLTSNNSTYAFGKSEVDLNVNSSLFSNSTSYVGSISAANVVSNSQLSSNLANYQTSAGLSANVATLTSNNSTYAFGKSEINLNVNSALTSNSTSYVGSVSAANVVSNSQLSSNLANYQTTAGLSANVATLTSNNSTYAFGKSEVNLNVNSSLFSNSTSFVGSVSAANVVSNSQLSSNLANYQTTAGLSANVATLTSNNSSYLGGVAAASYVNTSGSYTISGVHTHSANIVLQTTAGISANSSYGTSGQVLTTNGSSVFWSTVTGGGGGGASVTISATAPVSPSAGNLWWNTETGILYIYYDDGTSSQWVSASGIASGASGSGASSGKSITMSLIFGA